MLFIIIPVFNRWKFTEACLDSLLKQTYEEYKIVIVNHGSTDETGEKILACYKEVILLHGDNTMWWSAAMNVGVKHALAQGAQYILTLNNDLIVRENYLESLITAARENPKSLIGSVAVNIHQPEQVVFAGIKWSRLSARYAPAITSKNTYNELKNKWRMIPVSLLPGRGTLIPAKVFGEIGLFDEQLFPHYGADEDFSLRAKKNGCSLFVSVESVVFSHVNETGVGLQKNYIRHVSAAFTSVKSPVKFRTRWNWAKRHGFIPVLYFVFDMLRVSKSLVFRKRS